MSALPSKVNQGQRVKREKLFKIGEVMQETGLSRQTIHNYTLAGLIGEARRTVSGHRLYDESVFDRLEQIKILQSKNYTLFQIKKILDNPKNES